MPFEQTPGFQQEERAEQSGAAAGSLRVELSPLWPTGPFPSCRLPINHGVQWARQEPSQAGDVPEWGSRGLEECRGAATQALAGGGGLGFRCGEGWWWWYSFCRTSCIPQSPLPACRPSVHLLSVCLPAILPHCWKAACNPPLCPPRLGVFDISFPSTITLSLNIIALNIISSLSFASFLFSFSFLLSQSI